MNRSTLSRRVLGANALLVFVAAPAQPCTIVRPISPSEMVRSADVIVRAIAVEYAIPANSGLFTTGVPDSVVRFNVVEVLKGETVPEEVVLHGYLTARDDFNDQKPPYTFVRPGGRAGSCFANSYRRGAEFLLMLQGSGTSFTVNWYALGPVNEQLRSSDDPWLVWVRQEVKKEAPLPDRLAAVGARCDSEAPRPKRGRQTAARKKNATVPNPLAVRKAGVGVGNPGAV